MPGYLGALGMQVGAQAAGNFVNEGMGLIFQGIKNKQQLQQQRRLSELDIMNQTEMMKRSEEQQMRMWRNTSYPAQIEQMKKAGLNPGLMYGMGGGGGATTGGTPGHAGGAAASLAQASRGSEGMGIQSMLAKAQIDNINADTEKKKVETAKTAGVDTELTKTQTLSLSQGIENQKAQERLTHLQSDVEQVKASVARQTINEQMKAWENLVEKGTQEIRQLQLDNQLSEAQMKDKIKLLHQQGLNAILEAGNIEARTNLTNAQINEITEKLLQGWQDLNIKAFVAEFQANHPGLWNVVGGAIQRLANGLAKPSGEVKIK